LPENSPNHPCPIAFVLRRGCPPHPCRACFRASAIGKTESHDTHARSWVGCVGWGAFLSQPSHCRTCPSAKGTWILHGHTSGPPTSASKRTLPRKHGIGRIRTYLPVRIPRTTWELARAPASHQDAFGWALVPKLGIFHILKLPVCSERVGPGGGKGATTVPEQWRALPSSLIRGPRVISRGPERGRFRRFGAGISRAMCI